MLADFGTRSAYTGEAGGIIPYFQYRIGRYQRDYYLYVPKEPFTIRYHNEVFNKPFEYAGDDIFKYQDFHFEAFPEKSAFILFLDRQLTERLKKSYYSKERQIKLESAADWVAEKKLVLKELAEVSREDFPRSLQLVIDRKAAGKTDEAEKRQDNLTNNLEQKICRCHRTVRKFKSAPSFFNLIQFNFMDQVKILGDRLKSCCFAFH